MQVRSHAAGCLALQGDLAAKALEHVESDTDNMMNSIEIGPSTMLRARNVSQKAVLDIQLPFLFRGHGD